MADTIRRPSRRTAFRALALGLAANLAIAAVAVAATNGPGYLEIEAWSATAQGTNGVRLSATTDGTIPKQPDEFIGGNAIVGIAWVDGATLTAVVATIHPVFGRDSHQRPDSWHVHTVRLSGGTSDSDLCLAAVTSTPTAGIAIQGSTLSVNLDRSSMPNIGEGDRLDPGAIDLATGFIVQGDAGCASGFGVETLT